MTVIYALLVLFVKMLLATIATLYDLRLYCNIPVAKVERSWVQIPASYSGWPSHYNNARPGWKLALS